MIRNVVFLFVILAAVFVVYLPSYLQMQDLRHRNAVFEKRINDLEKETIVLTAERERLIKDPSYFEKVARERMGLIKDGEVIYKVVPAGSKKTEVPEEVKKPAVTTKKAAKRTKKKMTKKPVSRPAAAND